VLEKLSFEGLQVDEPDGMGLTPLASYIRNGDFGRFLDNDPESYGMYVVDWFLAKGASASFVSPQGKLTLAHYAVLRSEDSLDAILTADLLERLGQAGVDHESKG
jgi:hypothetical protein